MENNKLIAEFMGWDNGIIELKFHASWDWLMPVVEKIEQVHEGVPQELMNVSLFSTIYDVYKAVVKYIEWYNQKQYESKT